ncbi:MAG: FTR1 family protein [Thermomicrobiales bacterium]|nr:FTR1 family protein [Thermomicrobiales bacterium]
MPEVRSSVLARIAGCCIIAVLLMGGAGAPAGAQTAEDAVATQGFALRDALFDAQHALATDDRATASSLVGDAEAIAQDIAARTEANPEISANLLQALDLAATAAESGTPADFAFARGLVWSNLMHLSFESTITTLESGDTTGAGQWLLLRDFRPATRLVRTSAGAAEAIKQFAAGEIEVDVASSELSADLLDTYQARLSESLATVSDAHNQAFTLSMAEAGGKATGYWRIVRPSFVSQFGEDEAATLDAQIAAVGDAVTAQDWESAALRAADVREELADFRAAQLSPEEQARRAGQTLIYLDLVSVEYGRGVKNGEVVVPIEIAEAQSFYAGARAAFNDLRPTLTTIDPEKTAEVAGILAELGSQIDQASLSQNVTPSDEIHAATSTAIELLRSLYPEEWERPGGDAEFDVIASLLDQVEKAVAAGQYAQAESARLEAYAIYDAGAEKRLLAFSPGLVQEIEGLFWQGNGDTDGLLTLLQGEAGSKAVRTTRLELDSALKSARLQLGAGTTARGTVVFNAATIVFREGLEAVLILVSLTASMIGINRRFKKPLAAGAIGAFLVSVLLFFAARSLLLSLSRYGEKLEAVVSVVAIGVLLVVMNWFFHKVYWTRWIAGHHERRRAIIGGAAGQTIGLVLLGFTSVFREGGETVLFLQALVLDAGTRVVIEGTLLGLAGVAVVGVLVFALQKKLPHKKMLILTGMMLALVLVTMVGTTVHVLQVVGWAPITPIVNWQPPYWAGVWLGVFPTWEGVIMQLAAIVLVIGSYYLAEFQHHRSAAAIAQRAAANTGQAPST